MYVCIIETNTHTHTHTHTHTAYNSRLKSVFINFANIGIVLDILPPNIRLYEYLRKFQIYCHIENAVAIGINGNLIVQCRASMLGEALPSSQFKSV